MPVLFLVLWASGFVVGAIAVGEAEPFGVLALRFVLAAAVAIPLALRVPGWRTQPLARLAVAGVLLQATQFSGVFAGLSFGVPAALSALVVLGLTPLVTTGLTAALGLERADPRVWVGLVVGLVGVIVSLSPELGDARVTGGLAFTFVGLLGLAGGTVLQKHWVGAVDVRVSLAAQVTASGIVVVPLALVTGQLAFTPTWELAWSVGWLAWVLSVLAFAIFTSLLRRYTASGVSTLLLVVPAVTAVMAAIVLSETLHVASLVGMAITIAGVGWVLRRQPEGERIGGRR